MKIICTQYEKERLIDSLSSGVCPFERVCPIVNAGDEIYCSECVEQAIEWEVTKND